MKYPGAFILNEVGTNKELAKSYGVSERTINRWKNKARRENPGAVKKPRRPRLSTLQNFKGTRKELAKKYGVSERTAYRWIEKAKKQGAEIESRQNRSKYPGETILSEPGKVKEIADRYGVSERTIRRWRRRALSEQEPFEVTAPETAPESVEKPFEIEQPESDFFTENFGEEIEKPFEDDEIFEVEELPEYSDNVKENLDNIINTLYDADLFTPDTAFNTLDNEWKQIYINAYIQYQYDLNPYQFYPAENAPDISDAEKIANIDIWGDEFENWLLNQMQIDNT